ncbi:MAG TPA: ALQxL family class IV lanthipeptide [Nonomuraea sp.]|nr:ALQxL family class IV lanthipeptide [Nonomuraea sp.]
MTIAVEALQELPAQEEVGLAVMACCWSSTQITCGLTSFLVTTCHTCTNTG